MGGGKVGFAGKLSPHGGDPGGKVFPPMGQTLGGQFEKLSPHHGGKVEKIFEISAPARLDFPLKNTFSEGNATTKPHFFRLRRAVS